MGVSIRSIIDVWRYELDPRQKAMTGFAAAVVLAMITMAVAAPYITPKDPIFTNIDLRFRPPCKEYILGTDHLGRDVLSRIIYGARVSFTAAALAISITTLIGIVLGLTSGYIGGALDRLLALAMDSLYVFPRVVIAMLIAFVLGPQMHTIALAVALSTVPSFFRVTRSITLSAKERTFVEAARAIGGSRFHVLRECIVPQVAPSLMALAAVTFSDSILVVATLGFLGVGIPPPTPEWGTDLSVAREFLATGAWWNIVFPGLAIIFGTWGFLTLGEITNDLVNPRLRKR